jgi:hemoglobin-like flavoprotein
MTLTDTQKGLVQGSFALAAMDSERVAETFYQRLFEIAPHTKAMFQNTDIQHQGQKLMQTLATLVGGLDHLDEIVGSIQSLGVRHVKYGVMPADYQPVGEALIWTFDTLMAEQFTEETRAAWLEVYAIVSSTAIEATQPAAPQ